MGRIFNTEPLRSIGNYPQEKNKKQTNKQKNTYHFLLEPESEKSMRHEKWSISSSLARFNPEGRTTEARSWKMRYIIQSRWGCAAVENNQRSAWLNRMGFSFLLQSITGRRRSAHHRSHKHTDWWRLCLNTTSKRHCHCINTALDHGMVTLILSHLYNGN